MGVGIEDRKGSEGDIIIHGWGISYCGRLLRVTFSVTFSVISHASETSAFVRATRPITGSEASSRPSIW